MYEGDCLMWHTFNTLLNRLLCQFCDCLTGGRIHCFTHAGSRQNPKASLSVSEPGCRHLPSLPTEPVRLAALGSPWWGRCVGGGRFFPFWFQMLQSVCSYACIYSPLLPSGHLIFLLLLSTVINICIPLTPRQLKPSPKCSAGPHFPASLGGG